MTRMAAVAPGSAGLEATSTNNNDTAENNNNNNHSSSNSGKVSRDIYSAMRKEGRRERRKERIQRVPKT